MLADTPILILAGGLGTRLAGALPGVPKGLAAIGDKPFLRVQIELLREQGARRFVLCVGHLSDQIRDTFGDGSGLGVRIDYSEEKDQLLGTAGAVRLAGRFVENRAFVLNGDTYLATDYNRLLATHAAHAERGAVATLALAKADDPSRFGSVVLDDTEQRVVGFREKEPGRPGEIRWLNAGAYVIERALLDHVADGRPVSIEREVFPAVIAAGLPVGAALCEERFYDIGTPDDWQGFAKLYQTVFAGRAA